MALSYELGIRLDRIEEGIAFLVQELQEAKKKQELKK